jgi:hypothetical protein
MPASRALAVFGVLSALVGHPTLAMGQTAGDWKKTLKDAFEQSLYQKTNTASLEINNITQPGTVLVVQRDGLVAGRSHTIGTTRVTKIRNGQPKSQGGLGGLFHKTLAGSSHPLTKGDRVYLYGVDINDESIVFKLLTSDLSDITEDDGSTSQTRFKAAVSFEFEKGYLASADPKQIKTTTIDPFLLPETDAVATNPTEGDSAATPTPEGDPVASAEGDPVAAPAPTLELRKGLSPEEVETILGAPVSSSTNGPVTTSRYNAASGAGTDEVDYYNGVAVDIREGQALAAPAPVPSTPPTPPGPSRPLEGNVSAPPAVATGAVSGPFTWTAYSFKGTEHFRYDAFMNFGAQSQSGFYEIDAAPAGNGRVQLRVQGRMGKQEYSTTMTLAANEAPPAAQLARLGPAAMLLGYGAMLTGRQWQLGEGSGSSSSAGLFKTESTCQYAGVQGLRGVIRQNDKILMDVCVAPNVGLPLAITMGSGTGATGYSYGLKLTEFRP